MKWLLEERWTSDKRELEPPDSQETFDLSHRQNWIRGGKSFSGFVSSRKGFVQVWLNGKLLEFKVTSPQEMIRAILRGSTGGDENALTSKMPGKILKVAVKPGDSVTSGQTLVILEAMKMENHLHINFNAVVEQVLVQTQQTVESGQVLITFTLPKSP